MWHDQAFSQRNKATKTAGGEGGRGVGRNLKMGAGGGCIRNIGGLHKIVGVRNLQPVML